MVDKLGKKNTLNLTPYLYIVWFIVPRLDFDFLPELGEGVICVRADFPEGMSIDQTAEFADSLRSIAVTSAPASANNLTIS